MADTSNTKKTNMKMIKKIYERFLDYPIKETPYFPIIVEHPIYEYGTTYIKLNGENKTLNIATSRDDFELAKRDRLDYINTCCETLGEILTFVRKSYKLCFLKYCKDYLSKEDFAKALGDIWVTVENGNHDIDVPVRKLASWFKNVDKNALMLEEELEYLNNLPSEITVYRGVGGEIKNPNGLSWTNDFEMAKWFANRWNSFGCDGYIIKGTVKKEDVLAYFSRRGEETELIIDPNKVFNKEEITDLEE